MRTLLLDTNFQPPNIIIVKVNKLSFLSQYVHHFRATIIWGTAKIAISLEPTAFLYDFRQSEIYEDRLSQLFAEYNIIGLDIEVDYFELMHLPKLIF